MANATPSRFGQINNAGATDALFLKVFAGEVLASFERKSVATDKQIVRTIASGKSATFPVLGRSTAAYHTPGTELVGTIQNANEKVLVINDLLIAQEFIASIDDAMNHFDVRSIYAQSLGEALAQQMDKHVLQTLVQAALGTANVADAGYGAGTKIIDASAGTVATALIADLFSAAATMDGNWVPSENRYCYLKPATYYLLANATNLVNSLYGGGNGLITGNVPSVAGFQLVKTVNLPTVTQAADASVGAGGTGSRQAVVAANTVAICAHQSAVGMLKLMDLAVESAWDIRRQGTLLLAKYACGHGVLRPEAAVVIATA